MRLASFRAMRSEESLVLGLMRIKTYLCFAAPFTNGPMSLTPVKSVARSGRGSYRWRIEISARGKVGRPGKVSADGG